MKRHILTAIAAVLTVVMGLDSQSLAQAGAGPGSNRGSGNRRASAITGRILSDSGQPIVNARVYIGEVGRRTMGSRSVNTDEDGRFHFTGLPRGNYSIDPYAQGYVVEPAPEPRYYRPGDEVTFTAIKGGVITGTVTNATGDPIIEARVTPIRVRDANNRPAVQSAARNQAITDDRGQYRLYGLRPGVYLLTVGGRGYSYSPVNPYQKDVPTYYPSSTRDTAAEVIVGSGQEVAGVDIRYRGERGSAISGSVVQASSSATPPTSTPTIELYNAATHVLEDRFFMFMAGEKQAFDFYGVPDGDYYLVAVAQSQNQGSATSARYPIKVKGADLTGIQLSLIPDGSISGVAVLERAQAEDDKSRCQPAREFALDELLVVSRRDYKDPDNDTARPGSSLSVKRVPPDDKGLFEIRSLQPGRYRIEAYLQDENWYVRSINMPAAARSKAPADAAQSGVAVKSGERVTGLTVIVAEGAAGVSGSVAPAREGATLPDRLKVHLVPAEREQADNAARFRETAVQPDGSFSLSNIAPGKYFVLARPAPDEVDPNTVLRPAAWDAAQRKALGQEAAGAGVSLDLQPCQRAAGFSLKYAPQAKPARKPGA